MQPLKRHRKADNCRLIPSSKFATRQTHESFSRHANCLMTSSPAGERKELVCHECPVFSRKLLALDAVALGSRDLPFAAGCAECVAEPVLTEMAGSGDDRMGPTSAKFDPEMEHKDGQNPIQTAEIFAAANASDRARTSAISARECSRRSAQEADPTDARPLCSDQRCARGQIQRGVRLGENEGNRMRDRLPRTPLDA